MTEYVQTSEGRIAYQVYGEGGTPVVAIPGIGDTRASYRALGPRLAEQGYTLYAMDLRGHGDSDVGFGSYTSEDIGDDVVALLEALDLRDVVVLGNSIGAASSVHASLQTDRIARLVLLSGFVADPPRFALMRWMLGVLFAWPWGVAMWGMYRKTLFATQPDDLDANHAAVVANLREPGRLAAVRTMMCASKVDIEARLGQVSIPALVLMGAQDPDFDDPREEARHQAERLGGDNQVVMIEQAGHYPQVERPEEVGRAIVSWLAQEAVGGA